MAVRRAPRASPPRQLSMREWAELPEDVEGEWVDGRLEEEEMPTEVHELVAAWISGKFLAWLEVHGGRVTGAESKYAVSHRRGRKPDVSVFLPGRQRPKADESLISLAPDIVIEVITPTPRDERRDRIDKAREYAKFGIRWYWLVNPAIRTVEVLELDSKRRYVSAVSASEGRLKVPGCRGLTLELDALWRYAGSTEG